jgi:hypothetical protein
MGEQVTFESDSGRLRISVVDPPYEWEGLPDGMEVIDLLPGSNDSAVIVLLDPSQGQSAVRNIVKVGSDASVLWRGELPTSQAGDCFVSVSLDETGLVVGSTWSGYRVRLSPKTGELVSKEFTK